MRERKCVKFRVDMYDDTKFKIIDMKPERDLVHYVWTRVVTLAGKINLEGELYMSKNLPYTIETLAIEFNRSEEQIKLALDIFIELEMVEFIEGSIYRVKNFVKHQNIKVKEKIKTQEKELDRKLGENKAVDIRNYDKRDLEIASSGINKDSNMNNEINNDSSQDNATIPFESKKIKKTTRKKKRDEQFDITDESDVEDNVICWVTDGELLVNESDKVIMSMEF